MNNPFDYVPAKECAVAYEQLIKRIETLRRSNDAANIRFCAELESGKMLGVLICRDNAGEPHTLYAFSGQIGDYGFRFPGFVEPVYDYLDPQGYFKTKERDISRQNREISLFEQGEYTEAMEALRIARDEADSDIDKYREVCKHSKAQRDRMRESGTADDALLADMIRQSQFEKAELHRLRKKLKARLEPIEQRYEDACRRLETMKRKRHDDSEQLQQWLFSSMVLLNARGEQRSLKDIFADTSMKIPPSGAGECCAPKLLQAAYTRGWQPVAIAEYWYGSPKEGEVRIAGMHYPACRGKCLPILKWMLQGLELDKPIDGNRHSDDMLQPSIVFENEWFCVVDKPAGMLSVPGRSEEMSVQEWLERHYGNQRYVRMVHRLDQDTSGLLIATFSELTYKVLQNRFASHRVNKTYIADLEGDFRAIGIAEKGRIELPLSPDYLDRPRQRVDLERGKRAGTEYEFIGVREGRSRVRFYPHTGRTHQLRVHAASADGLGMPIVGDRLYGTALGSADERLHLHAHKLDFFFPINRQHYSFESPVPFPA